MTDATKVAADSTATSNVAQVSTGGWMDKIKGFYTKLFDIKNWSTTYWIIAIVIVIVIVMAVGGVGFFAYKGGFGNKLKGGCC
jgi:hypothetical protein